MKGEFDHLYKEEYREIVLHEDDQVLKIIRIPMPKAPPVEEIYGYGKAPKDQYFEYEKMPTRVKEIVGIVREYFKVKDDDPVFSDMIYDFFERNSEEYADELAWIKKQIHYRFNGKWVFINGRPFFLNRWHWFS